MVGSLTGAVASQRVTEARDGGLRLVGNQPLSAMAQARLTARLTSRAETKVGHSDPVVPREWAIAQRIKGTPGKQADTTQASTATVVFGTSMSTHHILGLEQVPRVRLFAD
eukprot:CAMPEP_0196651476 /NCGR_PEP_ID=MMETSP1086-20130531/419_1 /TAXON_ID=77921 /ORGANISM="Cyanoptyche  gloeocystis , Strain SAG4.97" /LENGTH=110 /DNA_ID=CAMNT_0041981483 /DNA_START=313 /DNA_END=646 /DNA_ORIENTATION=+